MIKPYYAIIMVAIILAIGVFYYSNNKAEIVQIFTPKVVKVESIGIENNNFVIRGQNLSSVKVWAVPTGTGVDVNQHMDLGNAWRAVKGELGETWLLPIPKEPFLATSIFAEGRDEKGVSTGTATLPVSGATDIYNALYGSIATEDKTKEFALTKGGKAVFDDFTLVFNRVTQDSRCPANANCVWAGNVTASVTLSVGAKKETIEIKDTDQPITWNGYRIGIVRIDPANKTTEMTVENTKYILHFIVTRL